MPIFPTRKWRKEETRCPPGAAQLATVGVGTSKAAGDEGAGLGARPGSVGPGAPLGAASPQLWAPWTEAKGTAGRRPHCPPRIQPWSQAWGALGSGLVSGATCWSKCPPASGGGGGTLDLQCPLLPARVDPRPVPLTQNWPGLGTRTELGRRADPMAGHGAGCGPGPPPSSPDSSKHPFTCGDVPAVLGDGRAAASNEQCRGWDPTPWAAPITAPSPKTCSVTLTLEAPPTLHGPQGLLFPPAARSPGPGVLGSASDVPPTLEDFTLAHSGPSSRSGRPRGAGIFLRPHLPVPPPRVQKTP